MTTEERKGDWFQTFTGVRFFPYDPRPEDVVIEDIAHHLALQCRYNGAVKSFYSVAQHSVLVAKHAKAEHELWALLHDAPEAYLGDMVRPLKLGMPQYKEVEADVMRVIAERFGLKLPEPPEIKKLDVVLLYTERRDLLKVQRKWSQDVYPLGETIVPWGPEESERKFMERFHQLTK